MYNNKIHTSSSSTKLNTEKPAKNYNICYKLIRTDYTTNARNSNVLHELKSWLIPSLDSQTK